MRRFFTFVVSLSLILTMCYVKPVYAENLEGMFGGLIELFGKKEDHIYGVGETADINGVAITFDRIMQSNGNSDFSPKAGNTFIVCEFTIENNSDEDVAISTVMCFSMKCDGKYYDLSLDALSASLYAGKVQLDRFIEPGKKETGVVAYELPSDWANFELKFIPDPFLGSGLYAVFSPYPENID